MGGNSLVDMVKKGLKRYRDGGDDMLAARYDAVTDILRAYGMTRSGAKGEEPRVVSELFVSETERFQHYSGSVSGFAPDEDNDNRFTLMFSQSLGREGGSLSIEPLANTVAVEFTRDPDAGKDGKWQVASLRFKKDGHKMESFTIAELGQHRTNQILNAAREIAIESQKLASSKSPQERGGAMLYLSGRLGLLDMEIGHRYDARLYDNAHDARRRPAA